ncbi:MAG: alpha/beta fold hydrolase [Myxococcota bacterium]
MGRKAKAAVAVLLALGATGAAYFYLSSGRDKADTRYNGAYRFSDGSLVTIVPSNSERIRMRRYDDGQVHALYYDGEDRFAAAEGFSSRDIVASVEFERTEDGDIAGAKWTAKGGPARTMARLPLRTETIFFDSGDLRLRGELVLPEGPGPFPVVVMVHGSEDYSGVDYYHLPYMFAAHGMAGFKFDKRGTGQSQGEYTQDFPSLSGDVVAAVELLKKRAEIHPERVSLIGLSQGGWVAPLAATKTDVHSIVVGFGTVVPLTREDRWGYVKRLRDRGFGDAEIAKADEFNVQMARVIFDHEEEAWDEVFALRDKYGEEAWFKAIAGSDSVMGIVSSMLTHPAAGLVPGFGWKLYTRWQESNGANFNRSYDPRPTLSSLSTPSLWLLAGKDSSLPTGETTEILDALKMEGRPISYRVYPEAEHGNVLFSEDGSGQKSYLGYVPTYFKDIMTWFEEHHAEEASPAVSADPPESAAEPKAATP